MPWVILVAVFALMWLGSALLIDAWLHRQKRPTLAERLARFQSTVSDEAESWLGRQASSD